MQLTMVSIKIGIVFSIFIVVTFGDSTDPAIKKYVVFAEIGGTVLLPCVQKDIKITDCIWTAADSAGDSSPIIAANRSIPTDERKYKIVGDWQKGNCSLQLSSVKEEDKMTYSCMVYVISNHQQVSKVQLLLGVKPDFPKIFYDENDVTSKEHVGAPEGKNFQLKCVVNKGDPPANISWVGFDSNKATNTSQVGETNSLLHLTSDDMPTEGEKRIVCRAEQPLYPDMVATVNVSIGYPYPIKKVEIRPLTIKVGEQFTCDADGIPRPEKYMWKIKEGQDWTEITGENSVTYKPRKEGSYKCSAKNNLSNVFVESKNEATVPGRGNNAAKLDFPIILMLSTTFFLAIVLGKM